VTVALGWPPSGRIYMRPPPPLAVLDRNQSAGIANMPASRSWRRYDPQGRELAPACLVPHEAPEWGAGRLRFRTGTDPPTDPPRVSDGRGQPHRRAYGHPRAGPLQLRTASRVGLGHWIPEGSRLCYRAPCMRSWSRFRRRLREAAGRDLPRGGRGSGAPERAPRGQPRLVEFGASALGGVRQQTRPVSGPAGAS